MRQKPSLVNLPRRAPVRYYLLLCDALRNMGVETAPLLQRAGIDPALFACRESLLNAAEVERLIVAARALSGREDLGFETGLRIQINSHDLLGYGLLSCPTVHDFLDMGSRHFCLIQQNWRMVYRRNSAGMGECIYTPLVSLSALAMTFALEAMALAHHNHMQHLLGQQLVGYDISLSLPVPTHIQRYQMLHPVRFHFDASALPGVRVVMPAAMIDTTLALGNAEVMREIDARCRALGQKPARGDMAWTEYVTMLLREARGTIPTMDDIAQCVQVSARTLDRHLKKDGQSFRQLSDQVRFERACEMLRVPGATAAGVAQQLGFSDAPNFTRAFRRVMGMTPGAYQKASK